MRTVILAALATLLANFAFAQHPGHQAAPSAATDAASRPYAGLAERRIKAVPDGKESDLREGRGMGLALAAELNGYPGPAHVLELADALQLTAGQRATAEQLRTRMTAEARAIGVRNLALEEELDLLFARGIAEPGTLAALTAAIGALDGRLREVHLATHIAMREALAPAQLAAYARLRGYSR